MAIQNTFLSDLPSGTPIAPPISGTSYINVGKTERIASVAGGAFLTYLGLKNLGRPANLLLTLTGGFLLYRGASGNCPVNTALDRDTSDFRAVSVELSRTITINKPRSEVYAFWRKLENLPRFMEYLAEVKQLDTKRSHWEARVPGGLGKLSWDAEIIEEEENRRLVWRSIPNSVVDNAGEVSFTDAPGNRGTEVRAVISYRPPVGAVGGTLAKWFNPVFEQLIKEDLRRFKQIIETGELPTIEGQSSARSNNHDPVGNQPIAKQLVGL